MKQVVSEEDGHRCNLKSRALFVDVIAGFVLVVLFLFRDIHLLFLLL